MRQKRLLILGGPDFQIPFIQAAKERGLYVGVVDIRADAPCRLYADEFFQASVKDKERILDIARGFQPDGITVGMVDIAVPACAYAASALGLPGISLSTAGKATDKYEMIKAFEQHQVPHPAFQFIKKERIGLEAVHLDYPLIVKPIDMAGSRGIFLVNSDDEMQDALKSSSDAGDCGDLLIEEYMDGPEVSVEMVVKNGDPHVVQITDKTTSGAPHFAETGHLQPSRLPDDVLHRISHVACSAATALGLTDCLGHAELKVTKNGPKMVELGARCGGDGIAEQLLLLSAGVSFPEISVKLALGEDFPIPHNQFYKSACIRFITTQEGVLSSIEGVEEAEAAPGVKEIRIFAELGRHYSDMIDSSGRLGYIITQGDSPEEAENACDSAFAKITVNYL